MSQELVYTSAPRGLKPGSQGFCSVAWTQGIPPQLIERLEALSGYRQVYAPQDPNAGLNPVAYSHLRLSVGGRQWQVVSRVAANGLDHTQRTNKFAHHVALEPAEMPAAGPAWLLSAPAFMRTNYAGEPAVLPTARPIPRGNSAPAVCRAWQALTGDAGWGGVLAQSALDVQPRPATIIYRAGTELLPLLAESLALLPPERRAAITFCSYFTKLPPGVDCRWRGVLDGTPEAAAVRRASQGLVIDLCSPLPRAANSPYVEAARSGTVAVVRPIAVPQAATAVIGDPGVMPAAASDDALLELLGTGSGVKPPNLSRPGAPHEFEDSQSFFPPPLPPSEIAPGESVRPRVKWRRAKRLGRRGRYLAIAASLLLFLGLGVGAWTVFIRRDAGDAKEFAQQQNPPNAAPSSTAPSDKPKKPDDAPPSPPTKPKGAEPPKQKEKADEMQEEIDKQTDSGDPERALAIISEYDKRYSVDAKRTKAKSLQKTRDDFLNHAAKSIKGNLLADATKRIKDFCSNYKWADEKLEIKNLRMQLGEKTKEQENLSTELEGCLNKKDSESLALLVNKAKSFPDINIEKYTKAIEDDRKNGLAELRSNISNGLPQFKEPRSGLLASAEPAKPYPIASGNWKKLDGPRLQLFPASGASSSSTAVAVTPTKDPYVFEIHSSETTTLGSLKLTTNGLQFEPTTQADGNLPIGELNALRYCILQVAGKDFKACDFPLRKPKIVPAYELFDDKDVIKKTIAIEDNGKDKRPHEEAGNPGKDTSEIKELKLHSLLPATKVSFALGTLKFTNENEKWTSPIDESLSICLTWQREQPETIRVAFVTPKANPNYNTPDKCSDYIKAIGDRQKKVDEESISVQAIKEGAPDRIQRSLRLKTDQEKLTHDRKDLEAVKHILAAFEKMKKMGPLGLTITLEIPKETIRDGTATVPPERGEPYALTILKTKPPTPESSR